MAGQTPTMGVEQAQSWTDFFSQNGGWGIAFLFGAVIVKLWLELKAKDQKIFELLDKTNDIMKILTTGLPPEKK